MLAAVQVKIAVELPTKPAETVPPFEFEVYEAPPPPVIVTADAGAPSPFVRAGQPASFVV
jgi:hypothetical protein